MRSTGYSCGFNFQPKIAATIGFALNYNLPILSIVACLLICISCDAQGPDLQKTQLARAELDRDVAELPSFKDFNTVKVVYIDVFNSEHGPGTCYWANAHLVIGSE